MDGYALPRIALKLLPQNAKSELLKGILRYGQVLLLTGDRAKALKAYGYGLKSLGSDNPRRKVRQYPAVESSLPLGMMCTEMI